MWCFSCGRRDDECPGGIWRGPRNTGREGICRYCARSAIRAFGETPDPAPTPIIGFPQRGSEAS